MKNILAALIARISARKADGKADDADLFANRLRSMTAPAPRQHGRASAAPVLFRRDLGHA